MFETLGDRMKLAYENAYRIEFPRKMDIIIRVDGQHFHSFTQGCKKPFDSEIISCMQKSTLETSKKIQGFKLAYVQSDEASFWINDKDEIETEAWFGNNLQKICSITSSMFSSFFNNFYKGDKLAFFDARAFLIPQEEIANYFLWRAKDWERNSVSMFCGSFYSHKEMHGQGRADQHEMLHKIGKNWTTDCSNVERNGTFIFNNMFWCDINPHYHEIEDVVKKINGEKNEK